MLASDIILQVREDFTEDNISSKYEWSDASLLRKLTEAERQACNRANLIYDDSTPDYTQIILIEGQSSYTLNHKITVLENVIYDGNIISKKTKDELDRITPTWRTDTGLIDNTFHYIVSGKTIRFSRIPDATDDGTTVYLEVYRLPDEDITSLSQEPEIPAEFHRDLIYWVLHECYSKKDVEVFDPQKALEYLTLFTMVFGEVKSAKIRQHLFESPRSLIARPATSSSLDNVDNDW